VKYCNGKFIYCAQSGQQQGLHTCPKIKRSAIYIHDDYVKTLQGLFPLAEPGQQDIQQDEAEGLACQTHQVWGEG
jgi:hypothetical protein